MDNMENSGSSSMGAGSSSKGQFTEDRLPLIIGLAIILLATAILCISLFSNALNNKITGVLPLPLALVSLVPTLLIRKKRSQGSEDGENTSNVIDLIRDEHEEKADLKNESNKNLQKAEQENARFRSELEKRENEDRLYHLEQDAMWKVYLWMHFDQSGKGVSETDIKTYTQVDQETLEQALSGLEEKKLIDEVDKGWRAM